MGKSEEAAGFNSGSIILIPGCPWSKTGEEMDVAFSGRGGVLKGLEDGGMNAPAVLFKDLCVRMGGVLILDSVNASVPRGSSTAIIGPNGAGKTTLLLSLLGQSPYDGRVKLAPLPDGRAPRIGYVPQRLQFDRAMPLTVLELIAMQCQTLPLWLGVQKRSRLTAGRLLATVEAEHLVERRLGALSGGEFQRVLLALALSRDPDILVLDEPVTGVDIVAERLICDLLESLRGERGFTQIMVTHDLSIVTAHATHVICLCKRVMGEGPPAVALRPEVLEATFGAHRGLPDMHGLPTASGGHGPGCDCGKRIWETKMERDGRDGRDENNGRDGNDAKPSS